MLQDLSTRTPQRSTCQRQAFEETREASGTLGETKGEAHQAEFPGLPEGTVHLYDVRVRPRLPAGETCAAKGEFSVQAKGGGQPVYTTNAGSAGGGWAAHR